MTFPTDAERFTFMPTYPAVSFHHVTKLYRGQSAPALSSVNLRIEPGEFVFLTGPSGSGKSTLIRLCLRESKATSGKVRVLGRDVSRLTARQVPHLRRRVGAVFQDHRLLAGRSVRDNVLFALEATAQDDRNSLDTVDEALSIVGLTHRESALAEQLSGGEAQRVAIARALVARPLVLLADEPTGQLDPDASEAIVDLLELVNQTGTTVVVATHDAGLVDRRPRRVIRLEQGMLTSDQVGGYLPVVRA